MYPKMAAGMPGVICGIAIHACGVGKPTAERAASTLAGHGAKRHPWKSIEVECAPRRGRFRHHAISGRDAASPRSAAEYPTRFLAVRNTDHSGIALAIVADGK